MHLTRMQGNGLDPAARYLGRRGAVAATRHGETAALARTRGPAAWGEGCTETRAALSTVDDTGWRSW